MALILDGNSVRDDIKSELKPRVAALAAHGRPPGLAVVLVGHNPASEIYVRNKIKACQDLGIYSETVTPPDSITTGELLNIVEQLNARHESDGIEQYGTGTTTEHMATPSSRGLSGGDRRPSRQAAGPAVGRYVR